MGQGALYVPSVRGGGTRFDVHVRRAGSSLAIVEKDLAIEALDAAAGIALTFRGTAQIDHRANVEIGNGPQILIGGVDMLSRTVQQPAPDSFPASRFPTSVIAEIVNALGDEEWIANHRG